MNIKQKLASINNSLDLKRVSLEEKKDREELRKEVELVSDKLDEIKTAVSTLKFPEQKDNVKVKNLSEIEIPKSVKVKKPTWYKQIDIPDVLNSVGQLFDRLLGREFKVDLSRYKSAKEAIAVRLSNGKGFVESMSAGIAAGMGDLNLEGLATEDTLLEISNKLNEYSLNQFEEGDITYLGKENVLGEYLIVRIENDVFSYATIFNNSTITNYTDAWTNRGTLNYSNYSEAFDD